MKNSKTNNLEEVLDNLNKNEDKLIFSNNFDELSISKINIVNNNYIERNSYEINYYKLYNKEKPSKYLSKKQINQKNIGNNILNNDYYNTNTTGVVKNTKNKSHKYLNNSKARDNSRMSNNSNKSETNLILFYKSKISKLEDELKAIKKNKEKIDNNVLFEYFEGLDKEQSLDIINNLTQIYNSKFGPIINKKYKISSDIELDYW